MSFIYMITEDNEIFSFDATLSLSMVSNNEVTEYPVESGFDITKGVIKKSDTYSLNGIISDHHIRESRDFRSGEVYSSLKLVKEERSTIVLINGPLVIHDLVISSLTSDEDASSGHAKNIKLTLKQIRTASSSSTKVPRNSIDTAVRDDASDTINDGTKSKNIIEEDNTVLRDLYEDMIGYSRGTGQ